MHPNPDRPKPNPPTARVMAQMPVISLTLLVGGSAQKWQMADAEKTVTRWQVPAPAIFPLPHPSWRNTAWLTKNPWLARDLLPVLKRRVRSLLDET